MCDQDLFMKDVKNGLDYSFKREVVRTAISVCCMAALLTLMGWSFIDYPLQTPPPQLIDQAAANKRMAENLAQYTAELNARMEAQAMVVK